MYVLQTHSVAHLGATSSALRATAGQANYNGYSAWIFENMPKVYSE